jgi:sec-independent protein translocase protein TatA
MPTTLAFMGLPGGMEWIIIALIGLLLFGRRLPEVGHAVGKSIVEFKRGVRGIQDEIEQESARSGSDKKEPGALPEKPQETTVARGETVEEERPPAEGPAPGANPAS